jgi:hypothetical protein
MTTPYSLRQLSLLTCNMPVLHTSFGFATLNDVILVSTMNSLLTVKYHTN